MNKIVQKVIVALILLSFTAPAFSADLIVEEFGILPTYSDIQSAVNAASDGDRILIKNRAGAIPWIQDVTIAKSVELLSYKNDTFFVVQGDYTITAAAGRTVSIIGMSNTSGDISNGGGAGATEVNIFDSKLANGGTYFANTNFRLNLVSSEIDGGYVSLFRGNVIGNDLSYTSYHNIYVSQTGGYASDTMMIIGNKIYNTHASYSGIYARSSQVVFHIKNNWIRNRDYAIYLLFNASTAEPNYVYNNTILSSGSSTCYGIYITNSPAASIVEVMNNVVDETTTGTSYGIYATSNSGQVNAYYNHIDNSHSIEIPGTYTFQSNNTTAGAFTIDVNGNPNGGSSPFDGGNPAKAFSDLDLTRGDAGCYGGSFTLNNFFPLFSGSARVFFVDFPFNVRQGSTLKVEAQSFDR